MCNVDEVKKQADRMHQTAQKSGNANDYVLAAELYEKCGLYNMARQCREAADKCQKGAAVNA